VAGDRAIDGDGGGGDGGIGADVGVGLGLGAGGFLVAGVGRGGIDRFAPVTPGAPAWGPTMRAQLEAAKEMLADGLITEDDYAAVKARILGL
jgi:hypothetical protein